MAERGRRDRTSALAFAFFGLMLQFKKYTHSGNQTIPIRDCSCPTNLQDFEAVGDLFQLRRGFRRTFSVTPDGLDDRGAFQLRNTPLTLIAESGSAEVVEESLLFDHHTESVCACIRTQPEFF